MHNFTPISSTINSSSLSSSDIYGIGSDSNSSSSVANGNDNVSVTPEPSNGTCTPPVDSSMPVLDEVEEQQELLSMPTLVW